MKSAGKARNNGLYRHIRTSKEIIRNLLNDYSKLQEELDKNEEYKDLLLERKEILRSNGFINKLQPRFEAICERLQEIDNETQKKLWGEVVLKDSEDEDIDFSFRDTSENVFQEALKTYCDNNKSRREYEKRF